MPTAGFPALILNPVIAPILPVTQMWGMGRSWHRERSRNAWDGLQEGSYTNGYSLLRLLPPSLALGSLQGYLRPQATVPQVQLWVAPLAQKAGGGHDSVDPARPQVEGVLDQFSKPMGA